MTDDKPKKGLTGFMWKFVDKFSGEDVVMTVVIGFLSIHFQRLSDMWSTTPNNIAGLLSGVLIATPGVLLIIALFIVKYFRRNGEQRRDDNKTINDAKVKAFNETHEARMRLFNARTKELGARMNVLWAAYIRRLQSYSMEEIEDLATTLSTQERLNQLIDQVENLEGDIEELGKMSLEQGIEATMDMKRGFLKEEPSTENVPKVVEEEETELPEDE